MRLMTICALAAAFAVAPFAAGEDKKPERPKLDAKEWKKQKSGLEIWDVKEGKGQAAKPAEQVTVHYTGWLTDKDVTQFDSTSGEKDGVTFPLGEVIKGWTEGVSGMK